MSKWEKLVNRSRSHSKEEMGQSLSPDSAHNHCPTAFYTQEAGEAMNTGTQGLECRGEWARQHSRISVCSFQGLGPGVFCINCSSRTLFSGDQLSQAGQMCRGAYLVDLTILICEPSLLNWKYSGVMWKYWLGGPKRWPESMPCLRGPWQGSCHAVSGHTGPNRKQSLCSAVATSRFRIGDAANFAGWGKAAAHIHSQVFSNLPRCGWSGTQRDFASHTFWEVVGTC